MSKTFTGTVNYTYSFTLSDSETKEIIEDIGSTNQPDAFVNYLSTLPSADDVICAIAARGTRTYLKEVLDEPSVTISPISVKVEAKKRA